MVCLNPALQIAKGGQLNLHILRESYFPRVSSFVQLIFLQAGTTDIRGMIRTLLPHVCVFVFVICPKMTCREFPVNGGCLRSGFLEAEPETRIYMRVIY